MGTSFNYRFFYPPKGENYRNLNLSEFGIQNISMHSMFQSQDIPNF